jgi:hypothetical protein
MLFLRDQITNIFRNMSETTSPRADRSDVRRDCEVVGGLRFAGKGGCAGAVYFSSLNRLMITR